MKCETVIIGAGPAGIGCALALRRAGVERVLVLEAESVGASFSRWPEEMRLITPSFHANPFFQTDLNAVNRDTDAYSLETAGGRTFELANPPILATGFHSALTPVKELFAWEDGVAQFTEDDESTLHPGLFYSGPSLVQRGSKFCFIYKFRARFGVVARAIARRLGHPEPDLEDDRRRGFLVDDLECCTNCECAVESKADARGANQ